FLAIGPKALNERNAEQYKMDVVDDQIDATTRSFLGLTVACARCHDHKFDPIPTADYYSLAGIFRSTETMPGVVPSKDKDYLTDKALLTLADPNAPERANAAAAREQKAHQTEKSRLQIQLASLRDEA